MSICPICGSGETKIKAYPGLTDPYKTVKGEFFFNRCLNCFHLFLGNPIPENEVWQYYGDNYGAYRKMMLSSIRLLYLRRQMAKLAQSIEDGNKLAILDVGAGEGIDALFFRSRGHRVVATDINEKSLAKLAEKDIEVKAGEFTKTNFPGKFDLIIMSHIFEHFSEPRKVVTKLKRLLKEDGHIFIKTPQANFLLLNLIKRYTYFFDTPRHFHIFSKESLRILLEEQGFRVETKDELTFNEFINYFKIRFDQYFNKFFIIPIVLASFPLVVISYLLGKSSRMMASVTRHD